MKEQEHSITSKFGKGLGLFLALLLLSITSFADVLTSLSFDKPAGYHASGDMVRTGNMGEMIADNTIQFSNSDPDQHQSSHYTIAFNAGYDVNQLGLSLHCTTALLLIERNVLPSGCPQCPRIFINGPPSSIA